MTKVMRSRAVIIISIIVLAAIIGGISGAVYLYRPVASHGLKVLASFYPIADMARNVGGDKVNVSLLVPPTVDVHEFEPAPGDIQAVATANVLIINGFGLEPWEPSVVASSANSRLIVVNCSQGIAPIPVPPEFQVNGRTIDPHIWLDPILAKTMVANIAQGLAKADPSDAAYFAARAQAFESNLNFLSSQIVNLTTTVQTRYFVTFHTAFGYFAREYNLIQIPVFGPFEDSPTAQDIQNVVNAIKQHNLCYVGYESLENPAISNSIASQTNATLILMDPIEGITDTQAVGMSYISLMYLDVANIVLALNHTGCNH